MKFIFVFIVNLIPRSSVVFLLISAVNCEYRNSITVFLKHQLS